MMLSELIAGANGAFAEPQADIRISHITHDSREVCDETLFVALPGRRTDGLQFLDAALARGAAAVAVPMDVELELNVPVIHLQQPRRDLAALASTLNAHPSRELNILGITGTNGKTTVASLVGSLCEHASRVPGQIGTNGHRIGQSRVDAQFTTPESPALQKILRSMVEARVDCVAMEVSSVGIDEHRVSSVEFDACAFLNLTVDHLDYHGTMENYGRAKARLFSELLKDDGVAYICIDDEFGRRLATQLDTERPEVRVMTVSAKNEADFDFLRLESTARGLRGQLKTPQGLVEVDSPLLGHFNAQNIAMAVGLCQSVGLSIEEIETGLPKVSVRGRLEPVVHGGDVSVFVDYAHSPDALQHILDTVRSVSHGHVWLVFGCGGDRDVSKRAIMGQISSQADGVIITNDNPRSESPQHIVDDILSGVAKTTMATGDEPQLGCACVVLDRAEAIRLAIHVAQPGDVVIIAGKGHETYQEESGSRTPFDDVEVARGFLEGGAHVEA